MANTPPKGYSKLPGSERKPLANARQMGSVDSNEQIEVTVYLRGPSNSNLASAIEARLQNQNQGKPLMRAEYAARHGANSDDIAKIVAFARECDLTVVETDVAGRRVVLAGTAKALCTAFSTELQRCEYAGGTCRVRTGPLHVPEGLSQIIVSVLGLDNRPQAQPHIRPARKPSTNATATSYTPPQLAQLYDFPTNANGTGQSIAIIELGGGYRQKDLQTYFQQLNIPLPKVTSVSVDGGGNQPVGQPNSADSEVCLDIEITGAIAPGAHIVVYFAPNTDRGILDAITKATHDSINTPSVISISWGGPEAEWTIQTMRSIDQAFQAAAALGITVCCAAGASGSGDGVNDRQANVDFPASSPYVLACGGTRLESANNAVTGETVWNDDPATSATGGGISDVFDLPAWQLNAQVPPSINASKRVGRGVPDVAANADPQTGYQVCVDGQNTVFGGTSAPLWAALIALINQQRQQSVGYLNPTLYQNYQQLTESKALRDIATGNNGGYSARSGWDACTGIGAPDGAKLLNVLVTQLLSATAARK